MQTDKLFYKDSHMSEFNACVLSCSRNEPGYDIILDKTAFFPNEGGQPADTGIIGSASVFEGFEKDGVIHHIADSPVDEGSVLPCRIDFEKRFIYMQTHSGEHIISGLVNKLYGFNNVGFHINTDSPGCTIDYSGPLSKEQLADIELTANEAVYRNIPVKQLFPGKEELPSYNYRSKLELTENVRLVEIEGIDICACCAPHVSRTGEIGIIKILSSMSHRGGTRLTVVCGKEALADYITKYDSISAISSLLSSRQNEVVQSVNKLLNDNNSLKKELDCFKAEACFTQAEKTVEKNGNLCFITTGASAATLREIVNRFMLRCNGLCCAFSGNDTDGYNYAIGSNKANLSITGNKINAALCGKGGGKSGMMQGSVKAAAETILNYFNISADA